MSLLVDTDVQLDPIAVSALRQRLSGALFTCDDAGYDQARAHWNAHVDRRPALVAQCRSAHDVALAVAFARENELELAVRSGGHNSVGLALCDDGMVVDLTQMKAIAVDPEARTARAETGATIGDLVTTLAPFGLATTTGTCVSVGLGGSTLGGGIGWLGGKHGLTIDNVLEFELVTADGEQIAASADENPDLFWALRGGGGNFGVVTAITYRLHPVGPVLGGMLIFPMPLAAAALRAYQAISDAAPDELIMHAIIASPPQIGTVLVIQACYSGDDLGEGERLLAPLRAIGPAADMVQPMPYADLLMMLTPPIVAGVSYSETAYSLPALADGAIDALLASAEAKPSPLASIVMHQVRGAASRVAPDATAYALREPHLAVVAIAGWMGGPAEPHVAWTQQALEAMRPFASRGLYVNFMGQGDDADVRDAYRANYARLAAIKAVYDPDNAFRRNQNIKPQA